MASFIQEGFLFVFLNDCEENYTYHSLSFGLDAYMLHVVWPKGAGGIIYIL